MKIWSHLELLTLVLICVADVLTYLTFSHHSSPIEIGKECCKCVCWNETEDVTANCIGRSLITIPNCIDIKNNTMIFLLSDNNITRLEKKSLERFQLLSKLDLSKNKIYFIHPKTFEYLHNLKILDLSDNCLSYNSTTFEPIMFEYLTRVTVLKINDNVNHKNTTSLAYPDYALGKLLALQVLHIDGLKNITFGKGFSNLTNLKKIKIASRNCNMEVITKNTFRFLPYLTNITIDCHLLEIEPGSFEHLLDIRSFNLSGNSNLNFEGVSNATFNIHHKLEKLYINRIVAWDSICIVIKKKFVKNLQNTSLQVLFADDNRIEAFETGAIKLFPKTLKHVSMRGHNFQYSNYVLEIPHLSGLTEVDLTGKDNKNFHYFQGKLHSLFRLEKLGRSYSENRIFEITKLPLPPNLTKVVFSYAQMYYEIANITVEANKLEFIDVSRNLLTRWTGPIHGLEGIKHIDLSYNFAHTVSNYFFQNFPNLKCLDLSFNLLGINKTILKSGNVFDNLTKLEVLDLTENYLTKLPKYIFSNLSSLKTLILSRNRIHSLDIEIYRLKQLSLIRLKDNNLRWIEGSMRSQFDQIAKNRKITLELSGNPIACTCSNLKFLKWMADSKANGKVNFGNLSNYYCLYSTGHNETLVNLESVYNNVSLMCYNYVGVCIGMSCVFFVTLSMVICGLLYRFRWKLRYFYYAARHKVNTVTTAEHNINGYTYDAFVSFAEEDRDFVVNDVLDKLERESGLNLNFHQRNFTPGRPIAENIIEAVKTSKRTLILLSRNFLESYWCIYELQMASTESVTTGRDVLLIVMMEDIPTRKIPTQILYHIQTDSYIQYPSEGDTDMFWRNLTDSLKR